MSTTKYKISEQVQRMLRGNPSVSDRVHLNDIMLYVGQECNRALKAEYFAATLPSGDTVPNGCVVVAFDAVPVATYKVTKCIAVLPAIPVSLPRGMGVLHVSKVDAIDEPFIPVYNGATAIVKPLDLIGEDSGLTTYETVGTDIIINRNLPGESVNTVYMRLVVTDFSSLGAYDPIPLNADMEADVVRRVYEMFAPPRLEKASLNENGKQ